MTPFNLAFVVLVLLCGIVVSQETRVNDIVAYFDNNAVRTESRERTLEDGKVEKYDVPIEYVDPTIPTNVNYRFQNFNFDFRSGSKIQVYVPVGSRSGTGAHDFHCKFRMFNKPNRAFMCSETHSDAKRAGMRLSSATCIIPTDFDGNTGLDILMSCTSVFPPPQMANLDDMNDLKDMTDSLFVENQNDNKPIPYTYTTANSIKNTKPFPKYFDTDFY